MAVKLTVPVCVPGKHELSRQAGFTELARVIRQPEAGGRFPGGAVLACKST
ncbi:hypothetical protein [Nonomuraea sp. bgisy101]|uniref:hypothetical protein n=1 Tax=Nonomuraea sp. bgisy101 TaxID=3413784 RepID=UPI003D712259